MVKNMLQTPYRQFCALFVPGDTSGVLGPCFPCSPLFPTLPYSKRSPCPEQSTNIPRMVAHHPQDAHLYSNPSQLNIKSLISFSIPLQVLLYLIKSWGIVSQRHSKMKVIYCFRCLSDLSQGGHMRSKCSCFQKISKFDPIWFKNTLFAFIFPDYSSPVTQISTLKPVL